MDVYQVQEQLENGIAVLPGSRDRHGGPVIFFPAAPAPDGYPYEQVVPLVSYFCQIPDNTAKSIGFTVVIDMKGGVTKYLKTVIRACQQALYGYIRHVLIIKPEQFIEKSRINFELMIEAYECRTVVVSGHKLSKYIDVNQLPSHFGGTFPYDHKRWIALRRILILTIIERFMHLQAYEKFLLESAHKMKLIRREQERERRTAVNGDDAAVTMGASSGERPGSSFSGFSITTEDSTVKKAGVLSQTTPKLSDIIEQGEALLNEIDDATTTSGLINDQEVTINPDCKLIAQRIESVLKELQDQKTEYSPRTIRRQKEAQRNETELKELQESFSENASTLCDWLLGSGEKWLLTLHEIGESKDEAKQIYRDHEQLEAKVQEIHSQVSELGTLADRLTAQLTSSPSGIGGSNPSTAAQSLRNQRRHVDAVARNFSDRVHRQKHIVKASVHFHNRHEHFSDKMDTIFDELCTSDVSGINTLSAAQSASNRLDDRIRDIDSTLEHLTKEGEHLMEELKHPETNSLGHEVTRDYLPGIVHIRNQLGDAHSRRKRCAELADVRKLKLQQLLQLFTCEKDGEQALKWIEELTVTLNQEHSDVAVSRQNSAEIRAEQLKLEQTARSTYDYGRQLCQVSLVLRRSLRMAAGPQTELSGRLEAAWARFSRAMAQHAARLSLTATFFDSANQVNHRLDEACATSKSETNDKNETGKRKFTNELRELRGMAEALVNKYDSNSYGITAFNKNGDVPSSSAVLPIRDKVDQTMDKLESKHLMLNGIQGEQTSQTVASTLLRNLRLDDVSNVAE